MLNYRTRVGRFEGAAGEIGADYNTEPCQRRTAEEGKGDRRYVQKTKKKGEGGQNPESRGAEGQQTGD